MASPLQTSKESVVVLYKGGRLPSWEGLDLARRKDYEQQHVDLMLSIAQKYRMQRLEGFKLIGPQQDWRRFWVIEFPTLEGAEAWIEAEMAPPYGNYGYYEYYLSRRWAPEHFHTWETQPKPPVVPFAGDPHVIQPLDVDRSSVVVLLFGRWRPEGNVAAPAERGDEEHITLMKSIAQQYGLMRLEAYKLITPQPDWHRAWVIEFPTLAGAEAWIDAEVKAPHGRFAIKTCFLAYPWAPAYFASWISR